MLIKNVYIDGYRSLIKTDIKDLKGLTIIFGENDVGKSNVLKCLKQAFDNFRNQDTVTYSYRKYDFFLLQKNALKTEIDIILSPKEVEDLTNRWKEKRYGLQSTIQQTEEEKIKSLLQITTSSEVCIKIAFSIHKTTKPTECTYKLHCIKWNDILLFEKDKHYLNLANQYKDADEIQLTEEICKYLSYSFHLIQSERTITDENYIKNIEKHPQMDINLFFKNFFYRLRNNTDFEETKKFKKIKKIINSHPFNFGELDVIGPDEFDLLHVFFTKPNELYLPIECMGTGVKQLLLLIARIFMSSASIIGIEEPELNFSPRNQLKVIELLKSIIKEKDNPVNQIIVVSHSEIFEQNMNFFASHNGKHTIIKKYEVEHQNEEKKNE